MLADLLAGSGLSGLSVPSFVFLSVSAFIAGFVRGFSGFGFALAAMPLMTTVLAPRDAIPVVLTFEILLTLQFARALRGDVAWDALRWLVAGMVAGTPFGIALLGSIPPQPMRIALCLVLLLSVAVLWRPPSRSIKRAFPNRGNRTDVRPSQRGYGNERPAYRVAIPRDERRRRP
jgi:uncharacterized membrane protein YfcA